MSVTTAITHATSFAASSNLDSLLRRRAQFSRLLKLLLPVARNVVGYARPTFVILTVRTLRRCQTSRWPSLATM